MYQKTISSMGYSILQQRKMLWYNSLRHIRSVWHQNDLTFRDQQFAVGCKVLFLVTIQSLTRQDREERYHIPKRLMRLSLLTSKSKLVMGMINLQYKIYATLLRN